MQKAKSECGAPGILKAAKKKPWRGWKSKIKEPAQPVPGESSLAGLQSVPVSLCPHEGQREQDFWYHFF